MSANQEERDKNENSDSSNENKLHSILSGTFLTPNKTENHNYDLNQVFRNMISGLSAGKTPDGNYTHQEDPDADRDHQVSTERKIYITDSSSSGSSNMFESPYQQPKKI